MSMAHINPMRYLASTDPFEQRVMEAIAKRRVEIAGEERQDLADRIIGRLAESIKK